MVEKKHLIVGVDPGTTTGMAILDLEGNLLRLHSSRTMSLKDLIHMIIGFMYPEPIVQTYGFGPLSARGSWVLYD